LRSPVDGETDRQTDTGNYITSLTKVKTQTTLWYYDALWSLLHSLLHDVQVQLFFSAEYSCF